MSEKFKSIALGSIGYIVFFVAIGGLVFFSKDVDTSTTTDTTQSEIVPVENSDYVRENGTSDCTSDCSGHDAGYEWAQDHDICDPEYDNGNSNSFNEGVQARAYDECYYSDNGNPI